MPRNSKGFEAKLICVPNEVSNKFPEHVLYNSTYRVCDIRSYDNCDSNSHIEVNKNWPTRDSLKCQNIKAFQLDLYI